MHVSISAVKFDKKSPMLASLSLSSLEKSWEKQVDWVGGDSPLPAWIGLSFSIYRYKVIPNNEGLLALKFFFDQRTVKEPSTSTLLRLADWNLS